MDNFDIQRFNNPNYKFEQKVNFKLIFYSLHIKIILADLRL